jgi:hypothetical protein
MKNFLQLFALLFLCNTSFGQSPFIQANTSKSNPTITPDTIHLNLTRSTNEVSKSFPTNATPINIVNPKSIDSVAQESAAKIAAQEDAIKSKENKRKANLEKALNTKLRKENLELEKEIDSLKINLQNAINEKKAIDKSQSEIEKSAFAIASQKIYIQLSVYNYRTVDADNKIKIMNDDMEKVENNAIKLKTWKLEKRLEKSDELELFDLYTKMVRENDKGKKIVEDLKADIKSIKEKIEAYKKNSDTISMIVAIDNNLSFKAKLTKLVENQNILQEDIANKFSDLDKKTVLNEKIDNVKTEINNIQNSIAKIYKAYKDVEGPKEDNLKTIAGVTQPLNAQGRLVPNISLLGYRSVSDANSSKAAQLKLFVAPTSGEKNNFNNAYRLFIPEASTYGFLADFSFGFIPSDHSFKGNPNTGQPIKKLGINLGAYYLSKSLANTDSSSFNVGMLQLKAGLQYIVIGKVLSLYANINPFYITDGVGKFQDNYNNYENRLHSFVDFGLNAYLSIMPESKDNDFFIDFDLGFIAVGGDVQSIAATKDSLIPRIKISLVKGFRF